MDIIALARETGFDDACDLDMASLVVMDEVRDMCAANRCHAYGKNWSCPPGCGTVDECRERIAQYSRGVLVQTVGAMEDDFDIDGINAAQERHKKNFSAYAAAVRKSFPDCLPLSAGSCHRCAECTYPDAPCRFPEERLSSMEAYGLLVGDVCKKSGMPYYRGTHTITFTSCILFK